MLYGPPIPTSSEEAEYYFQELRAQRLRATQLFHTYVGDDGPQEPDDDFYAYYEDGAR